MPGRGLTRREVIKQTSLLMVPGAAAAEVGAARVEGAADVDHPPSRGGPVVYESVGVRPLVNARGTYTILSGSLMLPEVRAAMDAASRHYVHLDELAEGIGRRLAELTGAEWAIVTSGCAAALTHATAACVAGGNPDLHVRLPDLRGFSKDEAIIPKASRNVYDAAVRAVGVRVIEVETAEELEAAFGPRTALVYIFAGPWADEGPLDTPTVAAKARARGVPVLVDAAAEILTVPNVHLEAGADLVGFSGGKCLRGPQSAGMLIGREDLVRAAWVQSAPHHGLGRAMKVGKEDAMGMLAAVEAWMARDHEAEWAQWTSWLEAIAGRISTIEGVTTSVVQPIGLSNRTPNLEVKWDPKRFGLSGPDVSERLFASDPRVALSPRSGAGTDSETGVAVNPYMMSPGEDRIVAAALHAILSDPPGPASSAPLPPSADLTGEWEVEIEYAAGRSTHRLFLHQKRASLVGAHRGDFVERPVEGEIHGARVEMRSVVTEKQDGNSLRYTFEGTVSGDTMSGSLDLGEYLDARWNARRRA